MSDQVNIQVPKELRKQIDEIIWPLLKRIPGGDKTKSHTYTTMLERGVKYTDLATGAEKAAAPIAAVAVPPPLAARHTRIRLNQILKNLQPFGARVELDRLPNDAALKKEMNASRMMLWASGADGHNIHVSPLLEQYTGCSAAHFLQDGWISLVHPEDQEKTVEIFREHVRKRKPVRVWYRLWRAEAVYGWVIDYAEPRFPNGEFAGYVGTMNDVNLLLFQWYFQQQQP